MLTKTMELTITTRSDKALEKHDYQGRLAIQMTTGNSEFHFLVGEQCSEDASLSRDFSDCFMIKDMLKAAHLAGQNGEPLDI